ncbi:MAG: hypothetical protein IJ692_05900 [Alloprevotella sp.]|nr:hypothetical protein [Alloprevotella sp.]
MKTYNKPTTNIVLLSTAQVIATSMKFNKDTENENSNAWTREQKSGGFGSGMWEDMK